MHRQIQVGNLSDDVDDRALRRLFEPHGTVRSAVINRHSETGHSTGVGVIEMESEACGAAAITALDHLEHCGNVLSVCWHKGPHLHLEDHLSAFSP